MTIGNTLKISFAFYTWAGAVSGATNIEFKIYRSGLLVDVVTADDDDKQVDDSYIVYYTPLEEIDTILLSGEVEGTTESYELAVT